MPDDTNTDNQNTQNQQNNDQNKNNQNGAGAVSQSKSIVLGCDDNGVNDAQFQQSVAGVLQQGGYQVENLGIAPGPFADYSYGKGGDPKGKIGVYLMAASLISFLDASSGGFDYNILGIRGDVTSWGTEEGFKTKGVPKDHHGDCTIPECDEHQGKTYVQLNDIYKDRCMAVPGETPEQMGQNIIAALNGRGFTGGGATSTVSSGGGAQIKDKTFEHCIRRICAATDSIFIVDNNVAILFPYTDWMAFTLRQKIDTIIKDEIDPNVFTMEYNNDGFYNKVSIAWGGMTLPERFQEDDDGKMKQFEHSNFTINDIAKKMNETNFKAPDFDKIASEASKASTTLNNVTSAANAANNTTTNTTTTTTTETTTSTKKKEKTTQEMSVDENGATILSEQYDSLVDKYGVLEKRVESKAPDLETAQYIVNALLIQYVRDFNNSCLCRVLTRKKYNGGTFHAVQNPFTEDTELFYLNSYNVRMQKNEPLYHDLQFKYGPESAEELADYQTFGGGAAGGTTTNAINAGSATEEQIWQGALVPCHQTTCEELRVDESDATDPQVAEDYYNKMAPTGKKFCLTCYGMSAWLYFQFNYKAGIPCQVVGNSEHHVIMLDRGNGMQETREDYRNHNLETGYRWREDQDTTVLLPAPSNVSARGGNTAGTTGTTNNNNTNKDNNKGDNK